MTKKRLLYSLASIVLLSFPWLGGSGITLLVALVPLLMLQQDIANERASLQNAANGKHEQKSAGKRGTDGKNGKSAGSKSHRPRLWTYPAVIFGVWWGVCTWWVAYAFFPGAVLSVLIGSLLCTSAFMLYDLVWRKGPKALAYTILVTAWICYELLYIRGAVSFPWLTLGGGFSNDVKLVQWYEFTGMFGGSLWVLVVNLLVYELIRNRHSRKLAVATVTTVIFPVALSLVMYFTYKEPAETVSVEVVQPNIDPYTEKFGTMSQQEQTQTIIDMIENGPRDMDYIVLPETALYEDIWEHQLEGSWSLAMLRRYIFDYSPSTTIVTGAVTHRLYADKASVTARPYGDLYSDHYNSAIRLDTTSHIDIHHKSILVIGAESTPAFIRPLEAILPDLGGISGNYGSDSVRKVFVSPTGVRSSAAICYESIYGQYYTEFVRNGAQIMFIITNDGWWKDTPGYRQHFSYARLRAIETRRSIARSANTGISGFIDQRGVVLDKLGWGVRGLIDGRLSLNDRLTFYVRYGDIIGRVAVLVLALSLLYFMAYRVKRRNNLTE